MSPNIFSKLFSGFKKDPYKETQHFLDETLLPLGFQNEYIAGGPGYVHNHRYTLHDTLVVFAYDVRDKEYSLVAAADGNKTETINGIERTVFDFNAFNRDLVEEEARLKTYQKFKNWLKINQIH